MHLAGKVRGTDIRSGVVTWSERFGLALKILPKKNLSMCYFSLLLQALEKPFHLGNLGNSSPCKYPDPYPGFKVWGGGIHP